MFRRKSKTELIKDRAVEALETATEKARDAVADGAAKVEDVRKNSDAYAEVARAKAKKVRKEAAKAAEAARKDAKKAKGKAPKQDPAVLALAPKIDQGRDALVEDLLPKVRRWGAWELSQRPQRLQRFSLRAFWEPEPWSGGRKQENMFLYQASPAK